MTVVTPTEKITESYAKKRNKTRNITLAAQMLSNKKARN